MKLRELVESYDFDLETKTLYHVVIVLYNIHYSDFLNDKIPTLDTVQQGG